MCVFRIKVEFFFYLIFISQLLKPCEVLGVVVWKAHTSFELPFRCNYLEASIFIDVHFPSLALPFKLCKVRCCGNIRANFNSLANNLLFVTYTNNYCLHGMYDSLL